VQIYVSYQELSGAVVALDTYRWQHQYTVADGDGQGQCAE